MAEGLARHLLNAGVPGEVKVSSAGAAAVDGAAASANAVEAARSAGIDISGHRSRLLNASMVREAALIVTMGEKHRHTVGVIEPAALDYTVQLSDFCDHLDGDVADPFGGNLETYHKTFDIIRECVEGLVDALVSGEIDAWQREE
jgi:protein-tyrosine-phosphatase